MDGTLTALFPDRENAGAAISDLKEAGFSPSRQNAEDFERVDYYEHGMPQGATLVTVDAGSRQNAARGILERNGGRLVDPARGPEAKMPTSFEGEVSGSLPMDEREQQALAAKAREEQSPFNRAQRERGTSASGPINNADLPTHDR